MAVSGPDAQITSSMADVSRVMLIVPPELARFVVERRIPALFVETSVSPRNIEAVQAAVRARDFDVAVGGNLYSDALGGVGSGAETYEGMIRHNVDTIVGALEGRE